MKIGGKEIWVDGCHNLHAAKAIAPFIERNLSRPRLLIFGIMSDKDVAGVTALLFPMFDEIIATDPYPPRSEPPANLVETARRLGIRASALPQPEEAIERALASDSDTILIAGSLYLAGAAIASLDKKTRDQKKR
jgi:dihydrofolate synthase/folylpolyglutamate synthase